MMSFQKIGDEVILSEAIRLVKEGVCVTFPVKGNSMLPFIVGGRDSVILEKPGALQWGDVVLALVESDNKQGKHYVIHRILGLDGSDVTLMGDGNLLLRERCKRSDVCAKVLQVVKPNGKKISFNSFWNRFAAKLWFFLLPFRRYLLWIFNKVK